jgi:hypothetical protein
MKGLSKDRIRLVRDIEKQEETFEPKNIWVRAWEIMLEEHNSLMMFLNEIKNIE